MFKYYLLIVNQENIFFKDYVNFVKLTYLNNIIEIYPNHTPLLGVAKNCNIFISSKKNIFSYNTDSCLFEFSENKLNILISNLLKN